MRTVFKVLFCIAVHSVVSEKDTKVVTYEDNNEREVDIIDDDDNYEELSRQMTTPANSDCYKTGARALGYHLLGQDVGHIKVDKPEMCQLHCQKVSWCRYWTYREEDHKLNKRQKRRCYLLYSHVKSKKKHGWTWGPKYC